MSSAAIYLYITIENHDCSDIFTYIFFLIKEVSFLPAFCRFLNYPNDKICPTFRNAIKIKVKSLTFPGILELYRGKLQ